MNSVLYASPWVPPEWIAAHGLRPFWIEPYGAAGRPSMTSGRGVCPYARAVLDAVLTSTGAAAVVMTTACDQMRYAAAVLEQEATTPLFLLNVPSTWQTPTARVLYEEELDRLSRFLVRIGGRRPQRAELARVMLAYDEGRDALRASRERLSASRFAAAVRRVDPSGTMLPACDDRSRNTGVPLALVGGPLLARDYPLLDLVEQSGARIVLDASEGGERTMPAPLDRRRVADDPLDALVDAYFAIPDVLRRPNTGLYDWLGRQLAVRKVRGILFRRYVGCDLWHAELFRIRDWSPVPVLDIDVDHDDQGVVSRTQGRLEAFLETLR